VAYVRSRIERAGLGSVDLPAKVAGLAQAVAALAQDEAAPRHTAPYWLELPADVYAARLAELDGWVSTVLAVNDPGSVRPCWAAHPPAVWELSTPEPRVLLVVLAGEGKLARLPVVMDEARPSLPRDD
jgi:hypothetical protein